MSYPPPPPGPSSYYDPPGPYTSPAAPPSTDKGLGWAGLGLALVVCVPCLPLVGFVLAIIALARRRFQPRWVAALTLVLGLGATALQVALVPSLLDAVRDGVNDSLDDSADRARRSGDPTEIPPLKLRAGDCFNDPAARRAGTEQIEATTVTLLPCTRDHDLEVYASLRIPGDKFPGQAAIDKRAGECLKRFRGFVGKPYGRSRFEVIYYFPSKQSWKLLDDRTLTCAIGHPDHRVTGTLRDKRR